MSRSTLPVRSVISGGQTVGDSTTLSITTGINTMGVMCGKYGALTVLPRGGIIRLSLRANAASRLPPPIVVTEATQRDVPTENAFGDVISCGRLRLPW